MRNCRERSAMQYTHYSDEALEMQASYIVSFMLE